tara:strand:+ start:1199 stop:1303 length:105 start_codon:yes stop_codon:yes gene_type:complete
MKIIFIEMYKYLNINSKNYFKFMALKIILSMKNK